MFLFLIVDDVSTYIVHLYAILYPFSPLFMCAFMKAKITLNLTGILVWTMFLHNKNHAIFDDAEGFGSTYLSFSTIDLEPGETGTEIGITVALSRSMVKKIEGKASNYCQYLPNDESFDLDNCLGRFYAQHIGCLSPWEKYSSPNYPPCQNDSQLEGNSHVLL